MPITPEIARANGLKGGRPKGAMSVHIERAKEQLIQAYLDNIVPINDALVKKAKEGDMVAMRELHDRVYGRSPQSMDITSKGESITISPEKLALAKEYEEKIKKKL